MSIMTILAVFGIFLGAFLWLWGMSGYMSSTGGTAQESYIFLAGVIILVLSIGWLLYRLGHFLWGLL